MSDQPTSKPDYSEEGQSTYNLFYQTRGPLPYGYNNNPKPKAYWDEPTRVARYYHAVRSMPPGAPVPSWLDRPAIDAAYDYLTQRNKGKPWYTWQQLPEGDPGNDLLRSIPMPPPDALPMPERQQFYDPNWNAPNVGDQNQYYSIPTKEAEQVFGADVLAAFPKQGDQTLMPADFLKAYTQQPQQPAQTLPQMQAASGVPVPGGESQNASQGGMTQAQYDALPWWQKGVIAASPYLNGIIGGVGGAVGGFALAGPVGAGVGLASGVALGAATQAGIDPVTGEPLDNDPMGALAKATLWMGKAAQGLEQGIGFASQVLGSVTDPGRYGSVQEVLDNSQAAWEASN